MGEAKRKREAAGNQRTMRGRLLAHVIGADDPCPAPVRAAAEAHPSGLQFLTDEADPGTVAFSMKIGGALVVTYLPAALAEQMGHAFLSFARHAKNGRRAGQTCELPSWALADAPPDGVGAVLRGLRRRVFEVVTRACALGRRALGSWSTRASGGRR